MSERENFSDKSCNYWNITKACLTTPMADGQQGYLNSDTTSETEECPFKVTFFDKAFKMHTQLQKVPFPTFMTWS